MFSIPPFQRQGHAWQQVYGCAVDLFIQNEQVADYGGNLYILIINYLYG
jgi:hypothetical protein